VIIGFFLLQPVLAPALALIRPIFWVHPGRLYYCRRTSALFLGSRAHRVIAILCIILAVFLCAIEYGELVSIYESHQHKLELRNNNSNRNDKYTCKNTGRNHEKNDDNDSMHGVTGSRMRASQEPSVKSMPPSVVKTVPQSGDTAVDATGTKQITVTFSKKMTDGSWSWAQMSKETFPEIVGKPRYLDDG